MENKENEKRLFFGIEVSAQWPSKMPQGRILDPAHRHMTLAFLGLADYPKLQKHLSTFPKPSFNCGLVGKFNECLFLPPRHPHVVAWNASWGEDAAALVAFQKTLISWLQEGGFNPDTRHEEWLPHVTICRSPFNYKQWRRSFSELPFIAKDIHLFESMGNLKYMPVWSYPLKSPFEEIEHTADLAFRIFGENLAQIHSHATYALAFKFPSLLPFISFPFESHDLDDVIITLNDIIAKADAKIGCPIKAISFHGEIKKEDNLLMWEMIIDV